MDHGANRKTTKHTKSDFLKRGTWTCPLTNPRGRESLSLSTWNNHYTSSLQLIVRDLPDCLSLYERHGCDCPEHGHGAAPEPVDSILGEVDKNHPEFTASSSFGGGNSWNTWDACSDYGELYDRWKIWRCADVKTFRIHAGQLRVIRPNQVNLTVTGKYKIWRAGKFSFSLPPTERLIWTCRAIRRYPPLKL